MNTYNLDLSTWDEGNTEPNLVFNDLLLAMDALAQFTPEAITASPPGSPTVGQSWIVAASATGVWTGKDQQVAVAVTGGWIFYPPQEGWEGYVKNLDANYQFNGTTWSESSGGGSSNHDNVTALSIASGVVNVDLSNGDYFTLTLTANVTSITFSNLPNSGKAQTIMVRILQDTTGSRTLALPASAKLTLGSDSAVNSAASSYTLLAMTTFDQGTRWEATLKAISA